MPAAGFFGHDGRSGLLPPFKTADADLIGRPLDRRTHGEYHSFEPSLEMDHLAVNHELNHASPPGPDAVTRKERSPAAIALSLFAFILVVVLGVYETIPVKDHKDKAVAPDPTALAIRDLQTSMQQAVDQLKTLQQTVSSEQAETKQLSDQVNALSGKYEALQRSFASAPPAPAAPVEPAREPARPKRGAR